jgi:hypothetical protein
MATVSKESYLRLVENRPYKFDREEVAYREGEGEEVCAKCVHFYLRKTDGYAVCEIFRDGEGRNEKPIDPAWTCSFHTVNGKDFPLLD